MNSEEWEEWKDWYRESIKEWKERYRKALKEWREKVRARRAKGIYAIPHAPSTLPIPPIPPRHSMSTSRTNVVASRIGDDELKLVDMLIEAKLFGTRSEAVAYLVSEGIKARQDVFDKVSSALEEIRKIRKEAEEHVQKLKEEIGLAKSQDIEKTEHHKETCQECDRDLSDLPKDISRCPFCGANLGQSNTQ